MQAEIKNSISYNVWEEVKLDGKTFVKVFKNFEKETGLDNYEITPTFEFEKGSYYADEIWRIEGSSVYGSSFGGGIVSRGKGERKYSFYYHSSERNFGRLVSVTFRPFEGMEAFFEKKGVSLVDNRVAYPTEEELKKLISC